MDMYEALGIDFKQLGGFERPGMRETMRKLAAKESWQKALADAVEGNERALRKLQEHGAADN